MAHACCADCGLRFTTAFAAWSETCPMCGDDLGWSPTAAEVVGRQLYHEVAVRPSALEPGWDEG